MKTKIFAYKGHVGAVTDLENGKFMNNIESSGEMGCVISTTEVQITNDAKEIIKTAKREGGSFAEMMLTKHTNVEEFGKSSIGLLGFGYHLLGKEFKIGRDCDLSVLDDCEVVGNDIIPEEFKKFLDTEEFHEEEYGG